MLSKTQIKEIAKQNGLPIEAICPYCGLIMKKTVENNGFEDQPHFDTIFTCLNCK